MSAWKLGAIFPRCFRPRDCAWFQEVVLTSSVSGRLVTFAVFARAWL